MDIALFGIQGSGKGTQARILAEEFGFLIFETGAALRALSKEDSDLGRRVKQILDEGNHVDQETVINIVQDFIEKVPAETPILFDGVPRNADQKTEFDALMKSMGREFTGVLIELSEEEAIHRLTARRVCQDCKTAYPAFYKEEKCEKCDGELVTRHDDTPKAIRVRLDNFLERTVPIIDEYKAENKMLSINGEQAIDAVTEELLAVLKPLMQ